MDAETRRSGRVVKQALAIIALVLALRLPFLHQAIQGDDLYYLYGAQHAQIEPLHPDHAKYLFDGDLVEMRGHSHPPLNSWILGALLFACGDVREVPFHLAYSLFSIIAALAMFSLARRFCERPFLATLLFIAVPAFVVNGNSLESDLPFLAFWMLAIAWFVKGVGGKLASRAGWIAFAAGFAVLEVDEGYLGRVMAETRPRVVVLLNLSRDQLDRISEVRMVVERWRDALAPARSVGGDGDPTVVVANADDPMVVWAASIAPVVHWVGAGQVWRNDAVGCPACEGRIVFADEGGWACERCSFSRPHRDAWIEGSVLVLADGSRHPSTSVCPGSSTGPMPPWPPSPRR